MNEIYIVTFYYLLDSIIKTNPEIYLNIQRLRSNGRWRIQVFGKKLAVVGDSELLCVEEWEMEKAFQEAAQKLSRIKEQIENLNNNSRKE